MPIYGTDDFVPEEEVKKKLKTPPPVLGARPEGRLESLANRFRQTGPGRFAEQAGNLVKKLVPESKTGQAIGLAGALIPGAGLLSKGSDLPFVGGAMEAASKLPEARVGPMLARLGLQGGAGALGASQEGKSPIGGAAMGVGAGAAGEIPAVLSMPGAVSKMGLRQLGSTVGGILDHLPGLNRDIQSGKNVITQLRMAGPEASAVYGKQMDSIANQLWDVPLFNHPEKGPMDFNSFKKEITDLDRAGWSRSTGAKKDGVGAEQARTLRAQLVKEMQTKLDGLSQGQQPSLADTFRQANRQYEKTKVMQEFAQHKDLLGPTRYRRSKAQEIMRDQMLTKLKDKLSPTEFQDLRQAIFGQSSVETLDRPGMIQRMGAPNVYAGGSSLRGRLPLPSHERPVISQFQGKAPLSPQVLRALSTVLEAKQLEQLRKNIDANSQVP